MRFFSLIIFLVLLVIKVNSQEARLKPFYERRSSYVLTDNCEPIQGNKLDSICEAFSVRGIHALGRNTVYDFKVGLGLYRFLVFNNKVKADSGMIARQFYQEKSVYTGDILCQKGFVVISNEGKKVSKRFSQLLLSAYLQETDSEYSGHDENFLDLPIKSESEFWKRNYINMGYGMTYAMKDNPFVTQKGLAIGFFYFMETAHYIAIFGGPFFGKTNNDKLVIPIFGVTSLILWKAVFSGLLMGKPMVKSYNRFAKMKYRIPKSFAE